MTILLKGTQGYVNNVPSLPILVLDGWIIHVYS